MPTIREILAGYQEANEREREELCHRLPRLKVHVNICACVPWSVALPLTSSALLQSKMYYIQLHERLTRRARNAEWIHSLRPSAG